MNGLQKRNGGKYMETDSQINKLESQIRECYGRVVYSHKTHEKCSDILTHRHNIIKIIQIILSALTTTGILVVIFGEEKFIVGIFSALLSTALFALNTYVKGHDLGELAQKHSDTATDLWDIRENYLSLLTDIQAKIISVDSLIEKRDLLQKRLSGLYKGCPRTINRAYSRASKALQINEELTFSDKEIDLFLPLELRKSKENNSTQQRI